VPTRRPDPAPPAKGNRLGALGVVAAAIALASGLLLSCEAAARPSRPPGPAPVDPLSAELARALEALEQARQSLPPDGKASRDAISAAEVSVERVVRFYLPLLRARNAVAHASCLCSTGPTAACSTELDRAEEILLGAAAEGGDAVARALERPLEMLEDLRLALADGDVQAPERLRELVETFDLMTLKGPLVLR
jgi:hypothetical protein